MIDLEWYVIQVRPTWEQRVSATLKEEKIDHYLPLEIVERRRQHGRKFAYARPLIHGYVFVQTDIENLHRLHAIDGAQRLVSFNGRPSTIPGGFIDEIMAQEDAGEFDHCKAVKAPVYEPGDKVRVVSGEFKGRVGSISKVKPGRRVQMLLDVINWSVSVEAKHLEPEEPEPAQKAA